MKPLLQLLPALALLALAGCQDDTVVVVPASGPVDNFFLTWEVQSFALGPTDCEAVGATQVNLDAVNTRTGSRQIFSFPCQDFQGTTGPVDVGLFSILANLVDGSGAILSQAELSADNSTVAGTIDLGHVIYQVQ